MRAFFRALCTLVTFFTSSFLLNRFLGWPTSTLTLLGLVGISFVVAGVVSDFVSRKEENRIGPATITAISAVLIVGSLTVGWPWDYRLFFLRGPEKYVIFKQEAALYLLSTEDNGPLENLIFYFQAPHIENREITDPQGNPVYKAMYHVFYLGENGTLLIEVLTTSRENWYLYRFYGQRTATPQIDAGRSFSPYGLMFAATIDNLYPREVLWSVVVFRVPEKDAKKVTVKTAGTENISIARFACDKGTKVEPFEKTATVYFWVSLSVLGEDNIFRPLCQYAARLENTPGAVAKLLPL
jgi:hypothetical protein